MTEDLAIQTCKLQKSFKHIIIRFGLKFPQYNEYNDNDSL